jgi:hypothetical protein
MLVTKPTMANNKVEVFAVVVSFDQQPGVAIKSVELKIGFGSN